MELSPILIICILTTLKSFHFQDITVYVMDENDTHTIHTVWDEKYVRNVISRRMNNFETFIILILVLITDCVRYRSIIILSSIASIIGYILYFLRSSIFIIELELGLEAFVQSSTIASSTYLYSKVQDKSQYQKITAYVQASGLIGIFLNKYWMQIYVNILRETLTKIPIYINTCVLIAILVCSYILPPVDFDTSTDAERTTTSNEINMDTNATSIRNEERNIQNEIRVKVVQIWKNFETAYTNINVLKWSIWYSLTAFLITQIESGGIELILIGNDNSFMLLTSASMAWHFMYLVISAMLVILCSLKPTKWETRGNWIISLVSFVLALLTLIQYFHLSELARTIISGIFVLVVDTFLTISVWETVALIPKNSYALVLGFNIFAAHLLQRIFEGISDDKFIPIYGMVFILLGVLFGVLQKMRRTQSVQDLAILEHPEGENHEN